MKANVMPRPKSMFQAYMLLFLVTNGQISVGIFGFQRVVALYADHDSWISVIVAGIVAHIVVWIMYYILSQYESADLYEIHIDVFGRWFGNALNMLFMIYYLAISVVIVRTYIELLQSWIFPLFPTWILALTLLALTWYGISGGIRIIAGMSTVGFFIIIFFTLTLYYSPLKHSTWTHLLPVGETPIPNILLGAIAMGLTISGFENCLFFYPFVKDKCNAHRFTQYSILFSNLIYLFMMILAIIFFSKGQLERSIWSSVNMLKIVKFPFLERLEYISTSVWMFVVIPGMMIYIWILGRGLKRLGCNQRKVTPILCVIILLASLIWQDREQIHTLSTMMGRLSLFFVFLYPFVLGLVLLVTKRFRKRTEKKEASE